VNYLQIILQKLGADSPRIGSVSFSLRGFQTALQNAGGKSSTFLNWVTLYEDVSDDLFEGEHGVNESPQDYPRVLLEYTIVGGKFAGTVNLLKELEVKAKEITFKSG
jgi:hypothetical protein